MFVCLNPMISQPIKLGPFIVFSIDTKINILLFDAAPSTSPPIHTLTISTHIWILDRWIGLFISVIFKSLILFTHLHRICDHALYIYINYYYLFHNILYAVFLMVLVSPRKLRPSDSIETIHIYTQKLSLSRKNNTQNT